MTSDTLGIIYKIKEKREIDMTEKIRRQETTTEETKLLAETNATGDTSRSIRKCDTGDLMEQHIELFEDLQKEILEAISHPDLQTLNKRRGEKGNIINTSR